MGLKSEAGLLGSSFKKPELNENKKNHPKSIIRYTMTSNTYQHPREPTTLSVYGLFSERQERRNCLIFRTWKQWMSRCFNSRPADTNASFVHFCTIGASSHMMLFRHDIFTMHNMSQGNDSLNEITLHSIERFTLFSTIYQPSVDLFTITYCQAQPQL